MKALVLAGALLTTPAFAEMPWSVRADAVAGAALAQPLTERWCLPATESALPLLNAVSAQDMVLEIKQRLDAAWVVVPAKTMSDAQWSSFVANVAWAKANTETYAIALAKQPAQTLKQYTDACGKSDPSLAAKLAQAEADLAKTKAELAAAQAQLTKVAQELSGSNAALAKANADLTKARTDLLQAMSDITTLKTERDAARAEIAAWRAWLTGAPK